MEMRDRERGTVFWSFGYPENIDQTHQLLNSMITINKKYIENITKSNNTKNCNTKLGTTRIRNVNDQTPTRITQRDMLAS